MVSTFFSFSILHAAFGKKRAVMVANLSRKKGSFRREFLTFFSRNVEMTHTQKRGGFARNGAKKVWVSPQKTIDIHLKAVSAWPFHFVDVGPSLK